MKNLINKILELWKKYEEAINYLIWGGIAFVLSTALFFVFTSDLFSLRWNEVFANTIDWVICVIFTFFTNKFFVFKSKSENALGFLKEFSEFVIARLITLLLEDLIIWLLCDIAGWNTGLLQASAKLIGQAVVIITNYFLSKMWIFKGKNDNE